MGVISAPKKAKLFCGIISSSAEIEQKSLAGLEKKFGEIDLTSTVIPFDFSDYYNPEMGGNLKRFWISFKKLITAADIAGIKIFTNSTEASFSVNNKRQINIDPGYITPANVILATTKDYSHRIYLSDGIYGEVTAIYKKAAVVKLPWSYPDYLSNTAKEFLLKARKDLIEQLRTA
ncbi:hypothetical protein AGMMS49573_00350 [Endomicrobiia bacterium]|uniref:DUF4416-domain protein n=1 Tax=Endomicrobium trichonymphae TaxID=1408204 RepID=B1GYW2_ENDTX|nr:DUF4416 family protein [Candidatus Endomicrobium trichonymphae]BAG14205.1 DUF4416-domain protein [Candidatus Endomicrobium trichonymphae]GHT07791.1 hypothetical protein AGMMS49532_01310 [Endomicrobiia bacterium]GHT15036.1 hypothetical protein AGMMS49573_00350 [Endomicrobiia bacterium]